MKSILIFGAGQVSQTLAEILYDNGHRTAGFVVDRERMESDTFCGLPVFAFETVVERCSPAAYAFVIGLSFKGINKNRVEKFGDMRELGYEPFTFVDRNARVSKSALLGEGCFIQAGNEIQAKAKIGVNAMLWANCHFGHHSVIGYSAWLSSHICISGACTVGDRTFIASGVTTGDGVEIGSDCIIGTGATVLDDVPDGAFVPGPRSVKASAPASKMARFL